MDTKCYTVNGFLSTRMLFWSYARGYFENTVKPWLHALYAVGRFTPPLRGVKSNCPYCVKHLLHNHMFALPHLHPSGAPMLARAPTGCG
jgi:hypothetical protein